MPAFVSLLAASAALKVASLNLCTDELLLALADDDQIASVTHLSQQAVETPYWRTARRHRSNDGSLLSVARLKPDIVLTMGGGVRDRRAPCGNRAFPAGIPRASQDRSSRPGSRNGNLKGLKREGGEGGEGGNGRQGPPPFFSPSPPSR